jgi:hypothetical protein
MLHKAAKGLALMLFGLLVATSAFAQDAVISRARALIDAKQSQAAFDLLDPLEATRAGEPEFDYLLGVAAIDSGKLTRGVFALERVLAVRPDYPQARAEIARAYFLMGENRVARQEFEAVRAANPPPEVANTIDRFLTVLDAREVARGGTGVSGYVEFGYGQDSNANAATNTGGFAIPAFQGATFVLAPGASQTRTWFNSVAAGVRGRYRINEEWALTSSASYSQTYNESFHQFDLGSYGGDVGASWHKGDNEITGALQNQQTTVGYNAFRRANGGTLQWRHSLDAGSQVTIYGQDARLAYPGQRQRDTVRTVVGGAWAKTFGGSYTPTIYAGAYGGQEHEDNPNFGYFGDQIKGVRAGGQVVLTPKLIAFTNFSVEQRRYRGDDPLFFNARRDMQWDIRVGANYVVGRNWLLTPAVSYTDNRSSIIIYDYSRWVVGATLRYDFR